MLYLITLPQIIKFLGGIARCQKLTHNRQINRNDIPLQGRELGLMGRIQDNSFSHIQTGGVRIVHCHSPLREVYYGFESHPQVSLKKKARRSGNYHSVALYRFCCVIDPRVRKGTRTMLTARLKQDALPVPVNRFSMKAAGIL